MWDQELAAVSRWTGSKLAEIEESLEKPGLQGLCSGEIHLNV
jgi:hypothetical protein